MHSLCRYSNKKRLDCASGFGAASFVTAAFGFAAAGEVVRRVALAEHRGEDLGAGWIRGERVGDASKNMDGLYGKGSA